MLAYFCIQSIFFFLDPSSWPSSTSLLRLLKRGVKCLLAITTACLVHIIQHFYTHNYILVKKDDFCMTSVSLRRSAKLREEPHINHAFVSCQMRT